MSTEYRTRGSELELQPGLKIKKLALRMEIGKSNLGQEIKRMFDMAKSSGLELDLTFSQKRVRTV